MPDTTVVYYTANMDYPALEESVRKTIRENACDLPIISVSHNRIDFGQNICVGSIEQSPEHVFMQLRVGAEVARSRFLAVCEADTLYPAQFFRFEPSRTDTYYYPKDGYITWRNRGVYWSKRLRELMGIVGRDHLLRLLDVMQEKCRIVQKAQDSGCDEVLRIDKIIAEAGKVDYVDLGAVVTLKTVRGMHMRSPYNRRDRHRSLPEWGAARNMWKRYRCE